MSDTFTAVILLTLGLVALCSFLALIVDRPWRAPRHVEGAMGDLPTLLPVRGMARRAGDAAAAQPVTPISLPPAVQS